jgi:hypothetical protein
MNKRTVLLCATFGILLLSAAHVPVPLGPVPSPSGAQAPLSKHAQVSSPSEDASLEQLRVAYAPTENRPSPSVSGASGPARFSERSSQTAGSPKPVGLSRAAGPPDPAGLPTSLAPPLDVEAPTLWLARAIYSETKLPHEQELVAWVVRNRVETGYRGKSSYREVVLDPYQFSAFNPGSAKRDRLMRLGPETALPGWRQALWVARYVRHAAPVYRPFSIETRHFYSERSMKGRPVPYWADGSGIVPPKRRRYTVEKRRFRFYEQLS